MRIDKAVVLGWLILALTGCTAEQAPPSSTAATPAATAEAARRPDRTAETGDAAAEPTAADETQSAEARVAEARVAESEITLARRLKDAQIYLDQARAAAEERRRLAALACAEPGQGDPDACVAAADEAMQAELQAARAEFEAQMRQPN